MGNIFVDFFSEIYQIIYMSSLIYIILVIAMGAFKWVGNNYYGLGNKFILSRNEKAILIIAIGIFFSYLIN